MPALILPLIDAAGHWPERGALIGLDLGTKTIGVAASDPDRRLATGVETIQRKAFKVDAARLLAIAAERNAVGFVLGLPINMDASEGPRAQSTRAFARNFSKSTELAIALWDERLSTAAVERELIGMDMSRARRAEVIDEHAAIFILQGALDRLAKLAERSLTMAVVIAALLPVFLLIVLGFILKRSLMRLETQWHGLERLTYYVLFPVLLVQTLVKADLSKVPVAGVGGALLLSALLMSLLCLALRPLLARAGVDGPAFTSIFQGATRWQTYVALAVSSNFYGDTGLALASVAMVAIIPLGNVFSVAVLAHYASPEKQSARAIVMTVIRNPLIWACAIGLAINVLHLPLPTIWHEVADALGRSSLAIGLLVTGAGLHLRRPAAPEPRRRGRRVRRS